MTKWPALAYYWPTDSTISAFKAIEKREKDNRTGDIWCHAQCYKSNPRGGNALFARKGPGSPHFWIGPGNFTKKGDCSYEAIKTRNSESYRYSQLFHDLFDWLKSDDVPDDWAVKSVKISDGYDFDIHVEHDRRGNNQRDSTKIIIIDKNRDRWGRGKHILRFYINQWPDSHIENFSEYGKRKIIELWTREDEKAKHNVAVKKNSKSTTVQKQRYHIGKFEVSRKEIEKTRSVVNFIDELIQTKRTEKYKTEFLPAALHNYGETLSAQNRRSEYIRNKMAALDNLGILNEQLDAANDAISINSMNDTIRENFRRDYVPTWPENWAEKLLMFRPAQSKSDDFSKIMEHVETKQELIGIVDEVYRMLFERDNPFFMLIDSFSSIRIYQSRWRDGVAPKKGLIADISGMKYNGSNRAGWVFIWTKDADLFFTKLIDGMRRTL